METHGQYISIRPIPDECSIVDAARKTLTFIFKESTLFNSIQYLCIAVTKQRNYCKTMNENVSSIDLKIERQRKMLVE